MIIDQPRCYGCGSQLKLDSSHIAHEDKTPMPRLECVNCHRIFKIVEMPRT